jgi:hypothetical protein
MNSLASYNHLSWFFLVWGWLYIIFHVLTMIVVRVISALLVPGL